MNILFGAFIGLIALTLLVVIHEFGHFIMAKKSGVKVNEFGIGLPPRKLAWLHLPAKEVQKFYDANKDKVNVIVVFTNNNTNLGKTQTYVKDNEYTFPAYYDENGTVTRGFAVDGFPFNLKINNGKVEEKLELPVDFDSLTASFEK